MPWSLRAVVEVGGASFSMPVKEPVGLDGANGSVIVWVKEGAEHVRRKETV